MIRRMLPILLAGAFLTGCSMPGKTVRQNRYQATFLDLFDTVTTVVGYAESEEAFAKVSREIHNELQEYHELFDIYHDYEGINNIKTINDHAGDTPVQVDERIIELLQDCKKYYRMTDGKVNAAMGSVLSLWHETREEGILHPEHAKIPEIEELHEANKHVAMDTVLIDEEASTVYLADAKQRLDVGAIAKGWAVERVRKSAPSGYLISVGGNVCATGPKPNKEEAWVVGIESPEKEEEQYLHTLYLSEGCVVTSGDYQRYYTVDGKTYHHIIDPDTLLPAAYWRSVSIVCDDSGLADALSTALFNLPLEAGQRLVEKFDACAMWVDLEGNIYYSPGFEKQIRT